MSNCKMSFEEKCKFLTGVAGFLSTYGNEQAGIPAVNMSDGPYGIRRLLGHPTSPQICHMEGGDTCFPVPSALGCTWNTELVRRVGAAIADDCIKEDVQLLLAPGVNMKRTPVCGRNFEYYSEDPVLSGELGSAYIQGVQSRGVSACLKHFAANNQETDRSVISVEVDESTLREIYLRPFEIAIKKGRPDSVMCAYNKLRAIWCSENKWLLDDLLRGEWGFDGLIISDWGAVHSPSKALAAGLDLQMPLNADICDMLRAGCEAGIINEEMIDTSVERVRTFAVKTVCAKEQERHYDRQVQHEIARKAAEESIVLLKNKDNILPLNKEKVSSIAVFGVTAEKPIIMGGGSSAVTVEESSIDSPIKFIREYCDDDISVTYHPVPGESFWDGGKVMNEVLDAMREADLSVVFLANPWGYESEGKDRATLHFPEVQDRLAWTPRNFGKRSVVIMQSGCCTTPGYYDWEPKTDAVLQMGYCGEGGGKAIADILFGKVNPSGKLSETFFNDEPEYTWDLGNGRYIEYKEGPFVGYRYYDKHPEKIRYPFGHGLSYTSFDYSEPETEIKSVTEPFDEIHLSFKISNTGEITGKEAWQLYVAKPDSITRRPEKELKAFGKIELMPGETKTIEAVLTHRDFAYYNPYMKDWVVENGQYQIMIGSSSRDIYLEEAVTINLVDGYTTRCEQGAMIL